VKDDVPHKRPFVYRYRLRRIPKSKLPHRCAACEAELDLRTELAFAKGIDREIILAAATEHREWMMLDIFSFGGWLHDQRNNERTSRRGRPIDPEIAFRDKRIAAHSLLLELEGNPTKAAIDSIVKLYRVPRSTAFAARKRWCPLLRKLGYHRASKRRRQQRLKTLEQACADPLF
jgi:hypothetical protein